VGDYVTLQRGNTYSGELVGLPGPALLGLGSIEPGGGFRADHYKTFGGPCPPQILVAPGDIYVALKGATKDGSMVGSVARLPKNIASGRLTQDTARLDFLDADPDVASYLYWVLRTPQYRQYCAGRLTGSAAASFSREDFLSYPVPSMTSASRLIVTLLEALEGKIELNRQISETLEELARALFKSWFVDFDPVRAKAEGRDTNLPQPLANLFPDSFETRDDCEAPAGWTVVGLDEVARFLNGLAMQKFTPEGGRSLPVIKIAQLRSGSTAGADEASAELDPDYIVNDGDVLFSWSGSLECVVWTGGRGALNQHLFKVTSSQFPKWFYYLWIQQHLENFRHIAASKATTRVTFNDATSRKRKPWCRHRLSLRRQIGISRRYSTLPIAVRSSRDL
jgi:type I restriction enzyme S subunit